MQRDHVRRLAFAAALLCAPGAVVLAATQTVFLDQRAGTSQRSTPLQAGDTLYIDALTRSDPGAFDHEITFTVGTGVDSVSGSVAWSVAAVESAGPRLVGINVDVFNDAQALVAGDTFAGVGGGYARSVFEPTPLAPGTYTLRITGTAVRSALFDAALVFGGAPPATAQPETGSLPGANPNSHTVFFTTLQDTRSLTPPLRHGDNLLVDTLVTSATGPLAHTVRFRVGAGIDRIDLDASWFTGDAAGAAPRLTEVDIALLDDDGNLLVSDTFDGVLAGIATSNIEHGLAPGDYQLQITGSGVRDASLTLALWATDIDGVFVDGFE